MDVLLRQASLDAPETFHHVIVRGIEKRQIVDDDKDRKSFVDSMGSLALEMGPAIRYIKRECKDEEIGIKVCK